MIKPEIRSSRPEAVLVLLLMQALSWAIAGLSAIPFALAGERPMFALGIASLLLALGTCLVAIGIVRRRRSARRVAVVLEVLTLLGALILLALPIGANHGLVAWMANAGLPLAVLILLRKAF